MITGNYSDIHIRNLLTDDRRGRHGAGKGAGGRGHRPSGRRGKRSIAVLVLIGLALISGPISGLSTAMAGPAITFTDIANDPALGLHYQRGRSDTFAIIEAYRQQSLIEPLPFAALPEMPYNTHGQPGIAVLDYDRDGDLDIYVSNGPGTPNSLYSNQLVETGALGFVDVAEAAGVAATGQDGMGVCYGDIDNDGDSDLLVLGRDQPNRLFENRGDGTFAEVPGSGLEGGYLGHSSCSMGDINGDGLLDVAVANSYFHGDFHSCFLDAYAFNQPNQLYLNQGNNTFLDVSDTSGIRVLAGLPPGAEGSADITWAVGLLDMDNDSDIDIVFAADQCALFSSFNGGVDRGYIRVMRNDGTGQFTDDRIDANGNWMGLSFGDLNCDGNMDLYASNFGDYDDPNVPVPYQLGLLATRWFLGNSDGSFSDPGVGNLISSVFGWGSAIFDYDNDGDLDIAHYGGLDGNYIIHLDSARGVLLENQDCTARFVRDQDALDVDMFRGPVQGVAIGDLNRDGFTDIVNASSFNVPSHVQYLRSPAQYGASYDNDAYYFYEFEPTPAGWVWTGVDFLPGDLSVQLSSGDNGNHWVQVETLGSAGITTGGAVNRDGVGAIVAFTPHKGKTVMKPIMGGASFGSQHSHEVIFGLGARNKGMVEVRWPSGVRNRLYDVHRSERVVIPEIPCSYDAYSADEMPAYMTCVGDALDELHGAGIIDNARRARLQVSAVRAFLDR